MIRKSIAALAAATLVAAPVAAQTAPVYAAPATETVQGEEAFGRSGAILPLIGVVALILAVLALTDTWPFDGDKTPVSP